MDSRPAKRQRVLSSDDESDSSWAEIPKKPILETIAEPGGHEASSGTRKSARLVSIVDPPSRPKTYNPLRADSLSAGQTCPSSLTAEKKSKRGNLSENKMSLHGYFQPATQEQRWASRRTTEASCPSPLEGMGDHDDLIEDDYDSYSNVLSDRKLALKPDRASQSSSAKSKGTARQSRPFVLPKEGDRTNNEEDIRPWAQRYGPSKLDELAVHKRKVADVGNWISDFFSGKNRRVCAHPFALRG